MATPQIEFHFVNSDRGTVPQDKAVRTLIRKQAMKKASAARRRDGTYGKHNLRQLPVFIVNPEVGEAKGWAAERRVSNSSDEYFVHVEEINTRPRYITAFRGKDATSARNDSGNGKLAAVERQRYLRRMALTEIPPNLSAKGYELASIKSDFDILDLGTLATLHVGRAVRAALSQDPYGLVHQLKAHKSWSYLSFLPKHFENSACLRDATACVTARARLIVHPGKPWEAAVISFYVKALDSLQKALDCPKQRYQPEVLCATEILAIYELLDPCGESAWIRHSAGAAKLIQLRGPRSYNTEFEKSLFIAQTFTITTECLLDGTRCYLAENAWQNTMRSVIQDYNGITDRSEIVVTLLRYKTRIPGMVVDVCNIICVDTPPPVSTINNVCIALRKLRNKLKSWYKRYLAIISMIPDLESGSASHDSHCKVYANYLACLMITSRLDAAVCPKTRREAEATALALADEALDLKYEMKSSPTCLFMAQTIIAAEATRETAEEWRVQDEGEVGAVYTDESGLVERWKLEKWATALKKMG